VDDLPGRASLPNEGRSAKARILGRVGDRMNRRHPAAVAHPEELQTISEVAPALRPVNCFVTPFLSQLDAGATSESFARVIEGAWLFSLDAKHLQSDGLLLKRKRNPVLRTDFHEVVGLFATFNCAAPIGIVGARKQNRPSASATVM
jgi:hypothetical protein